MAPAETAARAVAVEPPSSMRKSRRISGRVKVAEAHTSPTKNSDTPPPPGNRRGDAGKVVNNARPAAEPARRDRGSRKIRSQSRQNYSTFTPPTKKTRNQDKKKCDDGSGADGPQPPGGGTMPRLLLRSGGEAVASAETAACAITIAGRSSRKSSRISGRLEPVKASDAKAVSVGYAVSVTESVTKDLAMSVAKPLPWPS